MSFTLTVVMLYEWKLYPHFVQRTEGGQLSLPLSFYCLKRSTLYIILCIDVWVMILCWTYNVLKLPAGKPLLFNMLKVCFSFCDALHFAPIYDREGIISINRTTGMHLRLIKLTQNNLSEEQLKVFVLPSKAESDLESLFCWRRRTRTRRAHPNIL